MSVTERVRECSSIFVCGPSLLCNILFVQCTGVRRCLWLCQASACIIIQVQKASIQSLNVRNLLDAKQAGRQ